MNTKLKIVGLTGGIGSGKSTVADLFRSLGIKVVSADQITRDLVNPDQAALKLIIEHFGNDILSADGSLNRPKLKSRIFSSQDDRLWLENLLHPLAKQEILALKQQIEPSDYIVVEIPLLFETKFEVAVDRVLVVDCAEAEQIQRTMKRDGIPKAEIEAIIKTQVPRSTRLTKADDIIVNDGSKAALKAKVLDLHNKYHLLAKV